MAKDESKKSKDDKKGKALPAAPDAKGKKKGKKGKEGKEQGEKKPMSAAAMFFICFLLFLLMLVGGFAVLNFNWFGTRTAAILLLADGASPYEEERKQLVELQLEVEDKIKEIDLRRDELVAEQESIDKSRASLTAEEERIEALRLEAEGLMEAYNNRVYEFDQLVAIYGSMDTAKAAQALSLLENIDDIARLLSSLKKDTAAKILDNMDASLAASVTQRMLP